MNQLKKIFVNNDSSLVTVSAGNPIADPQAKWEYGTSEDLINQKFAIKDAEIDEKIEEQDELIYSYDQRINLLQNDLIELDDKVYDASTYSGLGRKLLKKHLVNGVNTLYQEDINEANTIYVIQYDYVLGENITVPNNCILQFDGGSISNGTIDFNNCPVISPAVPILIGVTPYHLTDINVAWFGILPSLADNSTRLNALFNSFSTNYTHGTVVKFNVGTYKISNTVTVPLAAQGLEIYGATKHAGYGHTIITTENENIGALMILRGQNDALYGISFKGLGADKMTGLICKRSETLSEDDNTNDHYCNTETVIENCQFSNLNTCVELWGRHNYLNNNGFTSFWKGIVIDSLVQHGLGGGPNRNNYIINNGFHASNPSISVTEYHYGCIVIDTQLSVENYIANNRNTSWTTFIYGYLMNSQVCNNYCCWSINHIAMNLIRCIDSFVNSNWFHYDNNYSNNVSGSPIITGSQGGIRISQDCNKSLFINNVITRTGETVFYFNGTTKGCTIANNQFYRNGNATGENTSYEIYLPAHASDNVIVNNFALRSINGESGVPNNHFIYLNQLGWDGASNLIQNNYVQSERLQGPYDRKPGLDTKRASNAYSGNQGFMYFDTDNNRPIFWTGDASLGDNGWVDANGNNPTLSS